IALTTLNIVPAMPIATAIASIATTEVSGLRRSKRSPNRRSVCNPAILINVLPFSSGFRFQGSEFKVRMIEGDVESQFVNPELHSYLNATIGSTLIARRAGTKQ